MKKIVLGLMIAGSMYGAEWYSINMQSGTDYKNWFCVKNPEMTVSLARRGGANIIEFPSPLLGVFQIEIQGSTLIIANSKQKCQKYLKGIKKHMKKASKETKD